MTFDITTHQTIAAAIAHRVKLDFLPDNSAHSREIMARLEILDSPINFLVAYKHPDNFRETCVVHDDQDIPHAFYDGNPQWLADQVLNFLQERQRQRPV